MEAPPDDLLFAQRWLDAQPAVASFLTALVPDPHAVDDLLQEVALTLYRRLDDYDRSRSFTGWALGIARFKALERWRGLQRERRVLALDPELLETLVAVGEELAAETEPRMTAMRGCIEQVDGRSWELLQLRYHQGEPPRRIAERLGLEAGHVRVLLNRLRAALRACVERRLASGVEA